jgi:hypothetical protein
MPSDPRDVLGIRVRLLPDAYIRLLIPPNNWTGTIDAVRESEMGKRTEYLFHLDERFKEQEEDFYVFEEEIEQCDRLTDAELAATNRTARHGS